MSRFNQLVFSAPKGNVFSLSKEFSDHEKTIRSKMVVANIEGAEKNGQNDGFLEKLILTT